MVKRRMGIIFCLLYLFLCMMPCYATAASTADAVEFIDPQQSCFLTITYRFDSAAVSDMPISLYKVADVSSDFQYTLAPDFQTSGLTLNGVQSTAEWNIIRSTLEAYILGNHVAHTHTETTDHAGQVIFSPLEPGLYLAIPRQTAEQLHGIFFDSALVALPGLGEDGRWQYQVEVFAKSEILPPVGPDSDLENFKILKLWRGDEKHSKRPKKIEVEIFRNGKIYETAVLSEENHWTYTWTAKADGAKWTVVEQKVPAGYTMTLEKRGTTFILTNTLVPSSPNDVPFTPLPKTGDTPHILLYAMIMYVSGTGLILIGLTKKKSQL